MFGVPTRSCCNSTIKHKEHIMKPEQTIQFLAELLELAEELNRIVKQYCRLVTTDQSGHGHYAEKKDSEYDALF
jgi:hypothetical protein